MAIVEALFGLAVSPHGQLSMTQVLERWTIALPITLLVIVAFLVRTDGRTPGKTIAQIRVIRTSGRPIDVRFALWREVAIKWVLLGWPVLLPGSWRYIGLLGVLDAVWILWDRDRRALHDILVGSRVVESPPELRTQR
jgi:uncharacterized RDD family membrane protein YckC